MKINKFLLNDLSVSNLIRKKEKNIDRRCKLGSSFKFITFNFSIKRNSKSEKKRNKSVNKRNKGI